MKKLYFLPLLFAGLLILGSCSKDKDHEDETPGDCVAISMKVSEALTAYSNDPSVQNCKNYFNALEQYINSSSCYGGIFFEAYKETFKALEAENCN